MLFPGLYRATMVHYPYFDVDEVLLILACRYNKLDGMFECRYLNRHGQQKKFFVFQLGGFKRLI